MSVSTTLCLSCGLCCDGTLFAHADVTTSERDRLLGRVRLEGLKLLQGCSALGADCRCGVYEERPEACRRFRCVLLTGVEKEQMSEEAARAAIDDVIARRQRLAEAMGLPPLEAVARSRETKGEGLSGEAKAAFEHLNRALVFLQFPLQR